MRLTVAIPTYNRPETLRLTLQQLMPQLTPDCKLLIVDNCSATPVAELLQDLLPPDTSVNYEVVRNRVNIGGSANILRCFELCETEWLWVLGDDDVPTRDAIATILRHTSERPDATFINFSTANYPRSHDFQTKGLLEFAQTFDHPGLVNFMSAGIWRVPDTLPNLRIAYHYAYAMSYIFVLLISTLGKERTCYFSAVRIIEVQAAAALATHWSPLLFMLGWNTVLELPMPSATRSILAAKLLSVHPPEYVAAATLGQEHVHRDQHARFLYHVITNRLRVYRTSWWLRLRMRCLGLLFFRPDLGWAIIRAIGRAAGRLRGRPFGLDQFEEMPCPFVRD